MFVFVRFLLNFATLLFSKQMYEEWIEALNAAGQDSSVVIATVTGAGDYFCSGNDLSNFTNLPDGMTPQVSVQNRGLLNNNT